jgi:hypothetical protein
MRTEIYITENRLFPFNIRVWVDFPLMPRDGETIKDYIDIDYSELSKQEKQEMSKELFDEYSRFLSDLTVIGPVWYCKDKMGPYCTIFAEAQ